VKGNVKNAVLTVAVLIAVMGIGYFLFQASGNRSANLEDESISDRTPRAVGGGVLGERAEADASITRTETGYEPKEVTIRKGQTVSWKNESSEFHWPASDIHPTHQIYSAFDPREPIAPGEVWSFTFEQSGTWEFHDHLRANLKGTVFVTE